MPQFDPTYFASQIFWLFVVFGAMYVILARVALPRLAGILETREAQIVGNLEKARELQKEADYVEAANRRLERETRDQARAIFEHIRDEIAAEVANRHTGMNAELAKRIDAAEDRIAAERQKALEEMRGEIEGLVRAAFTQLTGQLPSEQRLQQALTSQLVH